MQVLDSFVAEMRGIFGDRLQSVMVYHAVAPAVGSPARAPRWSATAASSKTADPVHTLTLVDQVTFTDLAACAARSALWEKQGLATPLVMGKNEFARSLDAFPLEYGHIIAAHRVIAGSNPFEGLSVRPEDIRRACEVQAKSHLIHLREAYIEAGGRPTPVARLIVASVAPFRALLASVARFRGSADDHTDSLVREAEAMGMSSSVVERILKLKRARELGAAETAQLFPAYLSVAERLVRHVDEWKR